MRPQFQPFVTSGALRCDGATISNERLNEGTCDQCHLINELLDRTAWEPTYTNLGSLDQILECLMWTMANNINKIICSAIKTAIALTTLLSSSHVHILWNQRMPLFAERRYSLHILADCFCEFTSDVAQCVVIYWMCPLVSGLSLILVIIHAFILRTWRSNLEHSLQTPG